MANFHVKSQIGLDGQALYLNCRPGISLMLLWDLMDTTTKQDIILSVSDLNREARYLLEDNFPSVVVEGEISNVAMPASGHWYLTLKDESAQIRCAMFRNQNMRVRFRPEDGMKILVKGKVSLYEGRGDFQLILEKMEERGDGVLLRAFEQLKEKLFRQGLFEEALKKPLPDLPAHIGVITSPTGAAVKDIISTLRRRFPSIPVTVLPVPVQGETAAEEMIRAIKLANEKQGCLEDIDVLLIGRGGGSLEDLWSFNSEALARCIADSKLPIVSAVGHEVDFTIADFVADVRAATPTAAAEIVSPDQNEMAVLFKGYERQITGLALDTIRQKKKSLAWLQKQLKHPGRKLQEQAQLLDDNEARLRRAFRNHLKELYGRLQRLQFGLREHSPKRVIHENKYELKNFHQRLLSSMQQTLDHNQYKLYDLGHALNTVSPLNTLGRGYSITYSGKEVVTDYQTVKAGDTICTRLFNGEITSTVNQATALEPFNSPAGKKKK